MTYIAYIAVNQLINAMRAVAMRLMSMSMCCRQDSDVDPNRAGTAHALPSGSCQACNGYTHTHSKWGTSAGPSRVWPPSWLGTACQQYVCCSTAERSPHERSAQCFLRDDALRMESQSAALSTACFLWAPLWAGVKSHCHPT